MLSVQPPFAVPDLLHNHERPQGGLNRTDRSIGSVNDAVEREACAPSVSVQRRRSIQRRSTARLQAGSGANPRGGIDNESDPGPVSIGPTILGSKICS